MLCSEERCLGCYACANVCPSHAICFEENEVGAFVPRIQEDKCIDCHACEKVCPVLSHQEGYSVERCYAAWSRDGSILGRSASGGIISTIYNWTVDQGGVAFGTEYIDGELMFTYSDSEDAAMHFFGSKYIHAIVGDTFQKVRELLQQGRQVVFVGTPCQIAGLKGYLHKEYEKLFLIDIICHGVSPQKYLREYVRNICRTDYDKVLFRGEKGNRIAVYKDAKIIYCKEKWYDPYSMAYAKGLISRENCYHCPFASLKRQGDITVGDFWGLHKEKLMVDATGVPFVSLVFVNSRKGESIFQAIRKNLHYEERGIDEAVSGNGQLSAPCKKHMDREHFLANYKRQGFVKALKSTRIYKDTKRAEIIKYMKSPLRKIKQIVSGGK